MQEPFNLEKYDFRSFKFYSSGWHCANAVPLREWMADREGGGVSGAALAVQRLPSRKLPAVPMWAGSGTALWPHCCPAKHHRSHGSPALSHGGLTQQKGSHCKVSLFLVSTLCGACRVSHSMPRNWVYRSDSPQPAWRGARGDVRPLSYRTNSHEKCNRLAKAVIWAKNYLWLMKVEVLSTPLPAPSCWALPLPFSMLWDVSEPSLRGLCLPTKQKTMFSFFLC